MASVEISPSMSRKEAWNITEESVSRFQEKNGHTTNLYPHHMQDEEEREKLIEDIVSWLKEQHLSNPSDCYLKEEVFAGFIIKERGFKLNP